MALAPGSRLGPYAILAPIGAGGMGEVYRARDERLERDVAVKVLPESYSEDPDRLRRFEQEAKAAGRLNHPNVLAIYDVGTHEGAPYVVSELLEGQTLREKLTGGALPMRKAVDTALQMARGLGAAHEKGIVHRDLKPENIFVTQDGRVKILDFGLAKLTRPDSSGPMTSSPTETRGTEPGVVFGTVGYMAPEQVRGQAADARADIFTFGAILHEMLSGRRAFRGDSSADVLSAILKEDPPPLSETARNVAAPLERLVAHCLEKNPEERFQSARDIAYDLEAVSGLSPSGAAAPRISAWHPARKLPVAIALAVAAAAAAAGVVAGRATAPARSAPPVFHPLTFRRGSIDSSRYAPDGQSVVYSARWDGGPRRLYVKRPDSADSIPLTLPAAEILSISPSGEMLLNLACVPTHNGTCSGTLAQAPMAGGAPKEMREQVQEADWASDGGSFALVRDVAEGAQLEFPAGKVLYKTPGHISYARVSPKGGRIAFVDHLAPVDDGGSIAVVDLSGKKTTLAGPFATVQGLAWSPDGREVWFTAAVRSNSRALYAVSLSSRLRPIAAVAGSLTLRDISKAGRVLMSQDVERLSTHVTGLEEGSDRDLSWFDWTMAHDLSEDGRTALLEEEGGDGGGYTSGLRPTDGSPIVRLSPGSGIGLSHDGKWALIRPISGSSDLLVPTGTGESRPLAHAGTRLGLAASWFPDGKRILFAGVEAGHRSRLYVQDVPAGVPRPISPEGFVSVAMTRAVSADGRLALAVSDEDGATWIWPVDGGAARRVDGIDPKRERPVRWSADGRGIYVREWTVLPFQISLFDLETGRKTPWMRIAPADLAGASETALARLSGDGKTCLYSVVRKLSDLYVVDGLR